MTFESLVENYGYWALLAGTFLEGETILAIGGFFAFLGYLDLYAVMAVAFIGSFAGDQLYFFIGRYMGMDLLHRLPWLKGKVERVHRLIDRFHDFIMLGFRFVYGIRILTPFVIGMNSNIKTVRFMALNAMGAALWSVAISLGGYFFGHAIESVLKDVRRYQIEIILVMLVVGLLLWVIHRYRNAQE